MTPVTTGTGTIYSNQTNTYGSDIWLERTDATYGLLTGYTTLPAGTLSSGNSSWMATVATGAFVQTLNASYSFMRVADNGFAYVFADNHVHKIDGTITGGAAGTVTKDVLLFPEGFTISDAIDYRSRLYIALHQYPLTLATTSQNTYSGRCGVYIWNRISVQLSSADYIEMPGVKEIKKLYATPDGELNAIVISDNGLVELRQYQYNGTRGVIFQTFKVLGIGAHSQFPDGFAVAGDKAIWLANDGNIYTEKAKAITKLFQVKAEPTTSANLASNISTGALFYGAGTETGDAGYRSNKQALTFSYVDSSTQYLKKIYPFDLKTGPNNAQAQHQGDVYTAVQLIPVTSVVRNVRIYNFPTSSTGTTALATVKLFFNQSTTATFPAGMTKTVTMNEAKRGYVDFKINNPYLHSIQIKIEWATGINLGSDTYLPSMAVVTHDDTKTQSPDNG